jgi:hypothetical protein
MKNLFLLVIISLFSFESNTVYVCDGPKSVAYHSTRNCNGLNNCSTSIREITLSEANKIGRRACRICKPPIEQIRMIKTVPLLNSNNYANKIH